MTSDDMPMQHDANARSSSEAASDGGPASARRAVRPVLVALVLSLALYVWLPYETPVTKGVCLLVFIGALWLTEAIPLPVTALLVPVFAAVASQLGMPVEVLVIVVALAASCGFALPVATPPNALVFGTGRVRQRDMLRAGLSLDLVCVVVLMLWGLVAMW